MIVLHHCFFSSSSGINLSLSPFLPISHFSVSKKVNLSEKRGDWNRVNSLSVIPAISLCECRPITTVPRTMCCNRVFKLGDCRRDCVGVDLTGHSAGSVSVRQCLNSAYDVCNCAAGLHKRRTMHRGAVDFAFFLTFSWDGHPLNL